MVADFRWAAGLVAEAERVAQSKVAAEANFMVRVIPGRILFQYLLGR